MKQASRKLNILAAVVRLYIETGEPVGSKAVCDAMGKECSSATIRNEMSDLCDKGYLEQPHTSAGRIPSAAAYRLYVERLMRRRKLSDKEKRRLEAMLPDDVSAPENLIEAAARALAEGTSLASVATTPIDSQERVQRLELIPLTNQAVLLLMITASGAMNTKVCRIDTPLTPQRLENFVRVANGAAAGMLLSNITPATAQTIAASLGLDAFFFTPVLDAWMELARDAGEAKVRLNGEANLLAHRDFIGGDAAYELLRFLSRREQLADVLLRPKQKLTVLIGGEPDMGTPQRTSIVTAQYSAGGQVGRIGVIGPTRMDYARIIPSLEYLAVAMGKILKEKTGEPVPDCDEQKKERNGNHGKEDEHLR